MKQKRQITKEELEIAVKNSVNFAQVCKYLNKPGKGATYELLRNRINEYNINTSHFLGFRTLAGKRNPSYSKRKNKEEILVNHNKYRVSHKMLKRALLESGIIYKCSNCAITEWNNKKITLDIDHINGDWKDCRLENLRFLCPNCHRQTDTYSGKNKGN